MIVFKDYTTFDVLGNQVSLISDEIGNSLNTVAEVDGVYYYLGNETPNVLAAILAWQECSGDELNNEELNQVMSDNHLTSGAI